MQNWYGIMWYQREKHSELLREAARERLANAHCFNHTYRRAIASLTLIAGRLRGTPTLQECAARDPCAAPCRA